MDIISHTFAGLVAGGLTASCSKYSFWKQSRIAATGALGGALPDIDAISMWSKFDKTFGVWFELSHTGHDIYCGKFWYSHHTFFHSIAASLIFAAIFGFLAYLVFGIPKSVALIHFIKKNYTYAIAFVLGCWTHLFCDMPTPASDWGGVNMFWPSSGYIGGTGQIWWWNNYDIFLIMVSASVLNLVVTLLSKVTPIKAPFLASFIVGISCLMILYQINTRSTDYNSGKYFRLEEQSKKEQQKILGSKVYHTIERFDQKMKVNF